MKYWTWWTLWLGGIFAMVGAGYYFDAHVWLWEMDQTKLSFLIIPVTTIAGLIVGFRWNQVQFRENDGLWFITTLAPQVGMVGTVVGMLIVLQQSFSSIDVTQVESMQGAIGTLANGMGTALITTLVGIVCSIWLSIQLTLAEN